MAIVLDKLTLKVKWHWVPKGLKLKLRDLAGNEYGDILAPRLSDKRIHLAFDRNKALYITFSPSRISSKNDINIKTVSKADFINACERISKLHSNVGYFFNIWNSEITRLDIARDASLEYPFEQYKPVIQMLPFAYSKGYYDFGTSVYKGNKSHQIIFYDKGIKEKLSDKLYRLEYRILNKNKIEEILKNTKNSRIKQTDEIDLSSLKSNFDLLNEALNNQVLSWFSTEVQLFANDYELIEQIKKMKLKPALVYYFALKNNEGVIGQYQSTDSFFSMFSGTYSRSAISKMRKTYQKLIAIQPSESNNSLSQRICEMRQKYMQ